MKKNSKYVQELYESNDKTYFIKNNLNGCLFKFRIIQYTVNKIVYYIGTTLCDSQFTIDILKELYKMRWNIESHFDTIKYNFGGAAFQRLSFKIRRSN